MRQNSHQRLNQAPRHFAYTPSMASTVDIDDSISCRFLPQDSVDSDEEVDNLILKVHEALGMEDSIESDSIRLVNKVKQILEETHGDFSVFEHSRPIENQHSRNKFSKPYESRNPQLNQNIRDSPEAIGQSLRNQKSTDFETHDKLLDIGMPVRSEGKKFTTSTPRNEVDTFGDFDFYHETKKSPKVLIPATKHQSPVFQTLPRVPQIQYDSFWTKIEDDTFMERVVAPVMAKYIQCTNVAPNEDSADSNESKVLDMEKINAMAKFH